jgi:hypothetical protein
LATFVQSTSGWSPNGFGSPNPNPSGYLVAPLVDAVGLAIGPYGALWLYLSVVGATCALGGWALARAVAGPGSVTLGVAAAAIATFNPWVYNKVVAGHTYMLLAYAMLGLLLAAFVSRGDLTSARAALLAVVAYVQLQFFLIVVAVLAVAAVLRRRWLAIGSAFVVALPTVIGIAGGFGPLSRTPITIPWEITQSVPPLKAAVLTGYFADYGTQFDGWGVAPALVLALLALAGAILGRRVRYVPYVAAAILLTIVAASGARGPLAGPFLQLVLRTPLVGIYRELYDLLGLTAIGYLALALVAAQRARLLTFAFAGVAAAFVILWLVEPPARYFVDARTLPSLVLTGPRDERFALLPPFQPLKFEGRGSGPDPDAGLRSDGRVSLNEYVPSYPVDAALARYEQFGDASQLTALGVEEIVERPGYATDTPALRAQLGMRETLPAFGASQVLRDGVAPRIGIEPFPRIPALLPRLGSGQVFFPDWPGASTIRVPLASNASLNPATAWVDVRLMTIAHPDFASPLGGAYTEQRLAVLPVERADRFALSAVVGQLTTTDGRYVARSDRATYAWVTLPPGTTGLRCDGRCALAAFASEIAGGVQTTPAAERALEGTRLAPWLIVTDLDAPDRALLRLNDRYDPAWQAYVGSLQLTHLRVDATSNGWVVPPATRGRAFLIEWTAAAQAGAEIAGAVLTIALIAMSRRGRAASPV